MIHDVTIIYHTREVCHKSTRILGYRFEIALQVNK